MPIVHDAIEARVQRFTNTLFPQNGRYTDVVANVPNSIHAIMGLLDHYVKRDRLRTKAKELLRNGEVEGQYTVYVDWIEHKRFVTRKVEKHPLIGEGEFDPTDTFMDVDDDEIIDMRPSVHLIAAQDLAILPPTWDDIETDAEVVVVRRWWTKARVKAMSRSGEIDKDIAKALLQGMEVRDPPSASDPKKDKVENAGIKWKAGKPVAMVYETWKRMKIDDKTPWCKIYLAGPGIVAGMFENPNWEDRCPVISKARMKVEGSGWGKSPVDYVEQLQYMANDWINMAGDNGMYSLLPIVMTDPEKNPQLATMVMNLAAVWQTSPNDTKFVEMPQLWKDALAFVNDSESRILKAFGLNPAMIAMGTTPRKQTQAAIAQEQMVALANITDEVSTLEDELFSPILQRFFELDQQHRDEKLAIKIYGQMGVSAQMQSVPPFAWDDRYEISWRGSQVMQSAQATQQMIAGLNILSKLPPVLPNGMKIDIGPIIETFVENTYGPRLGSRILIDVRDQQTVAPDVENQLMSMAIQALVHPADDDAKHIQAHAQAMQAGDPSGLIAAHIQMHQQQMAQKMQAQQGQQQPQGGAGPRPGAQPGQPRGGQNPPGSIHADRLRDPNMMPRRSA